MRRDGAMREASAENICLNEKAGSALSAVYSMS